MDRLTEEIRHRAKEVQRHPKLTVLAILDKELLDIAHSHTVSPWEVMRLTLDAEIWPVRYLRNTQTLTIQEQAKLHLSHVAVVGAGGLGGQVLSCLARVGIGTLTIVDPDRFEESNLNRQAFSETSSMGSLKVLSAEGKISAINPFLKIRVFPLRFGEFNGKEILEGAQIVIDALDNRKDRLKVQKVARELHIPIVHGAVAGLEGHIMTIFPEDPGFEKIYGEGEPDDSMKPEVILGVLAPTPMLIGTLQAVEAIKFILKRGRLIRSQLLYIDLESAHFTSFQM